ncbi:MAG TPA: cobalamin-binding protein [Candidatus Methylomirabilis sp.]|nr:cobalamin-binding protein [Candidatus Methylomirabilis sp.]
MTIAVRDAFGQPFEMAEPARRVISLIPSITEIFFRLGIGDRIVGVTRFCTEPAEGVAGKPKVGGQKNPRLDAIIALKPDLVVANVEENRKEDVEAMRAAGLPVLVTYPRTVHEGIQLILDVGGLTGTSGQAERIAARCEAALGEVEQATVGRAPVRVFCPIWRNPYMTINHDTFIHDMLRVCGGENIFLDHPERYPGVNLGEVTARKPEVILLPDEPFPFGEEHLAEFEALGEVPAVRAGRLRLLDGKVLSWYGPRIADSLPTLFNLLHR